MSPNPFERFFKQDLDNDRVFDKTVSREVRKIFNEGGVNSPSLYMAYERAQQLNGERKSPQHKHYLLNLIQSAALNSPDLHIDLEMNPRLLEDIKNQIVRMRAED